MRIKFSFRRIESTLALEQYIINKFSKAERVVQRYRQDPLFEFSAQRITNHREGDVYEITVTVHMPRKVVVNTEHAADVYSAIDTIAAELVRQLEQGKEKPIERFRRNARKLKEIFRKQIVGQEQ